WDGTTTKSLASYTDVGYNPRWLVSFDGSGQNCARLLPSRPAPVQGFSDGGTFRNPVTVGVPAGGGGSTTVEQVPTGGGASQPNPGSASPSPGPSASPPASPSPSASPGQKGQT